MPAPDPVKEDAAEGVRPGPNLEVNLDAHPVLPKARKLQVEITWKSIFRVLIGLLLAYIAVTLWPILKLLVLSALIAAALYPIVSWTYRKGLPRWFGLLLASLTMVILVVGFFAIIGPMVYRQAGVLGENLPKLMDQVVAHLPSSGVFHKALQKAFNADTLADSQQIVEKGLLLLKSTAGGLAEFLMVIVLAIYLMVDGPKALKWLVVFFPQAEREKIARALSEISGLVFAYVAGQFLVSTLAAVYVFVMLSFLGVPMALLLAIIAGVLDILPFIGFVVAVSLAMTVGMTVSSTTAVLIFCIYFPYHLFENFFVIPNVYGRKLRLSPVTVALAIAVAALLAGIVGAIAVLPLVAAYPVIERLWLAQRFAPDTVTEHAARSLKGRAVDN